MLDEDGVSLAVRHSLALARASADHPFSLQFAGKTTASTTSPPNRRADSSAATPIGAGRSGFQSTSSSSRRCRSSITFTATTLKSSADRIGALLTLWDVSMELSHRLMRLFTRDADGRRPVFGGNETFNAARFGAISFRSTSISTETTARGLGASHQTGWTALVAKLIQQCGEYCGQGNIP